MHFINTYLVTLIVFFLIDILWLGFFAKNMYQEKLGFLLKTNVNWTAAIPFYLLFIAGMIFFVINPALAKNSALYALIIGGFFGLITYATYDMTNLATLKNWPLSITILDISWGTFLCAITSFISFFTVRTLIK
ncbi:DUF2177 family protein [Bacillus sp. FJAT-49732]|uniref:DUF2177 family protein n=2 Tax=Lederbergia citrisecunda TaxID=2833583 RepID=A0A942TQP2_9BACI|nr:DUF2177 family protein [Lederbergia citrisecunda]